MERRDHERRSGASRAATGPGVRRALLAALAAGVLAAPTSAQAQVPPDPAQPVAPAGGCTPEVTIGAVQARASCFRQEGDAFLADDRVTVNGITFNALSGRPLRFEPSTRRISLGRVQLRLGSIVLFQGDLAWTVPQGDRVTLAEIDLETHSRVDEPPEDTEAALDLEGDDAANVQGFELEGRAVLELEKGRSILTGTIELPRAFADAEGNGLTGSVTITADNDKGVHLSGIEVHAPLALLGKLELHNLTVRFAGETSGAAEETCNARSPGLRWDGRADAVVVPTPEPLRIEDVGLGFADGALSYARARWEPPAPGRHIGAGVRVQRVAISLCAGEPTRLEGRVSLTALPEADGSPALQVPDAGLLFEAGERWRLRAEAPAATLAKAGRPYRFSLLSLSYGSEGVLDFGGKLAFTLPVAGPTPVGALDAAVQVSARAEGFIERDRFSAALAARGCFAGTLRIADTLPVAVGDDDLCADVQGVMSSTGIAVCGGVTLRGTTFNLGAGYRWGGAVDLLAGSCDLSPWSAPRASGAAQGEGARSFVVRHATRGLLVAARGVRAPVVELRGPRGERIRVAADPRRVVRARGAVAFTNIPARTAYVLLARPSAGTWVVAPRRGTRIRDLRTATALPTARVTARVVGGASRGLRYRLDPHRGQRVTFEEHGGGVRRVLGQAAPSGRGALALADRHGQAGRRRIVAVVEQAGVPRRRMTVGSYRAAGAGRPEAPPHVRLTPSGTGARVTWGPAAGAARYGIGVALSDGRRLFFLRDRHRRTLVLPPQARTERATVRVVGLASDGATGPAAAASKLLTR